MIVATYRKRFETKTPSIGGICKKERIILLQIICVLVCAKSILLEHE